MPGSTTGAAADKRAGVTALVLFELRRRGRVARILLADAQGTKLPLARETMREKIGEVYRGLDTAVECFPADDIAFDASASEKAMDTMQRGDAVIIFTPDHTHFPIAMAAIALLTRKKWLEWAMFGAAAAGVAVGVLAMLHI